MRDGATICCTSALPRHITIVSTMLRRVGDELQHNWRSDAVSCGSGNWLQQIVGGGAKIFRNGEVLCVNIRCLVVLRWKQKELRRTLQSNAVWSGGGDRSRRTVGAVARRFAKSISSAPS